MLFAKQYEIFKAMALNQNNSLSNIALKSNTTYPYVLKIIKDFEKIKYCEISRVDGRTNKVKLTKKGNKIFLAFNKLEMALK